MDNLTPSECLAALRGRRRPTLTKMESERFVRYINRHGGQERVAVRWHIAASTISRVIHGHHAPSPMLRERLREAGVVIAPR